MKVTLTFDNGPTAETTAQVLRVLDKRGVPATFFVLGRQLADPKLHAIATGAHSSGHRIGNHSYSHSIPFGELQNPDEAIDEIVRTEELLGALAGQERLFRPFGGGGFIGKHLFNTQSIDHLKALKYTVSLWTSVPRDWEDPEKWPERALHDCSTQDWSVVVLHDLPTGAMDRLDSFLASLIDRGCEFSQDFPVSVTPLRRGVVQDGLAAMISDFQPHHQTAPPGDMR